MSEGVGGGVRESYVCGGGKGDVGRGRSQKRKVAIVCTQMFCRLNFHSFHSFGAIWK